MPSTAWNNIARICFVTKFAQFFCNSLRFFAGYKDFHSFSPSSGGRRFTFSAASFGFPASTSETILHYCMVPLCRLCLPVPRKCYVLRALAVAAKCALLAEVAGAFWHGQHPCPPILMHIPSPRETLKFIVHMAMIPFVFAMLAVLIGLSTFFFVFHHASSSITSITDCLLSILYPTRRRALRRPAFLRKYIMYALICSRAMM
jgi:hypothetical protein